MTSLAQAKEMAAVEATGMMVRAIARRSAILLLAIALSAAAAIAQPTITNLGTLTGGATQYSYATAISADGSAVAGFSSSSAGQRGFRWTALHGMQSVGVVSGFGTSSTAQSISGDGFVVTGISSGSGNTSRAFRWTDDSGMQNLGVLGTGSGSAGLAVSADGLVVGGFSYTAGFNGATAMRWTFATGLQNLGGTGSNVAGLSADGSVAVGTEVPGGDLRAFRWTAAGGRVPLAIPAGADSASAYAVSGDGTVVAGTIGDQFNGTFTHACRWTNVASGGSGGGTAHDLGALGSGGASEGFSYAYAISADGASVVGASTLPSGDHAVLWTPALGLLDLNTYLPSLGVDLAGWTLVTARGISADGTAVAGDGRFNGADRAFLIRGLPLPCQPLCSADFNCSHALEVQDIFDFLNAWFSGDPHADFNGNALSVQDIFDFLNAWFSGC